MVGRGREVDWGGGGGWEGRGREVRRRGWWRRMERGEGEGKLTEGSVLGVNDFHIRHFCVVTLEDRAGGDLSWS